MRKNSQNIRNNLFLIAQIHKKIGKVSMPKIGPRLSS